MNRRGFLGALLGAGAMALDPDRLLWAPGKKLISVPKSLDFSREAFTTLVCDGWGGASNLKIGDTIFIRKPSRFVANDELRWLPGSYERFAVTEVVVSDERGHSFPWLDKAPRLG